MSFSPEEIEQKRFLIALRGYDMDQVDAYLRTLAADYRDLLKAVEVAREQVPADAEPNVDLFEQVGEKVGSILRAATEVAARLRAEADREAAELRAGAAEEAARTIHEAYQELDASREVRAAAEREAHSIREAVRLELEAAINARTEAAEREARSIREAARQELEAAAKARAESEEATQMLGMKPLRVIDRFDIEGEVHVVVEAIEPQHEDREETATRLGPDGTVSSDSPSEGSGAVSPGPEVLRGGAEILP